MTNDPNDITVSLDWAKKLLLAFSLIVLASCQQNIKQVFINCDNATAYNNHWANEIGRTSDGIGCYIYHVDSGGGQLEQFYPCDTTTIHEKSYTCFQRNNDVILEISSRDPVVNFSNSR